MDKLTKKVAVLENPFVTDSAHKAYEQALKDMLAWLILHNECYKIKPFALAYPLFLNEDDYWALRQRIECIEK